MLEVSYVFRVRLQAVCEFDSGERDFPSHPQGARAGAFGVYIGGVLLLRFSDPYRHPGVIEKFESSLIRRKYV